MENVLPPLEMDKELYVAATNGNKRFLLKEGKSNSYLLRKTHKTENNIIHIAIRHEQHDFIEACLKKFSFNELFHQNSYKNNPLHTAAEVGNLVIVKLLYEYIEKYFEEYQSATTKPWVEKNFKGNTPLHVAIIHDNVSIAKFLLEKDHNLALIVNKSKEAPLHLAINQHANYSESKSIMAKVQQSIKNEDGGAALTDDEFSPQEAYMSSMIKLLVDIASFVACWPDSKGLNPLHRAAFLVTPYNLMVTKFIIEHCPQSAEVCDDSGKSILHLLINKMPTYKQCKTLLGIDEIYALRNNQDHQGNTPLHIAASKRDINMVRVLLESSTKLNINNADGISAASMIQQKSVLQELEKRKLTKEEIVAIERANITVLRERIDRVGLNFLRSQDDKGKNILHILMHMKKERRIIRDDFVNFIEEVLDTYPELICQTDHEGDTPIHVLVRNHPYTTIYVASRDQRKNTIGVIATHLTSLWASNLLLLSLEKCNECLQKLPKKASIRESYDLPLLVQNNKGNLPLHEALIADSNRVLIMRLFEYNKESAGIANKCDETPLHLIARRTVSEDLIGRKDIELLVEANAKVVSWPDQDCLTPILRAFKVGNIVTGTILCSISPEAAKTSDNNKQIFWHYLVKHPSEYYVYKLLKQEALRDLLESKDINGNTPLHLALKDNRFDLVKLFLEFWREENDRKNDPPSKEKKDDDQNKDPSSKEKKDDDQNKDPSKEKKNDQKEPFKDKKRDKWLVGLLNIPDVVGKTPADIIADSPSLPIDIEKGILDESEMIGVLSVWGIPAKEMKTYVNTIGVIATLLTTITFTTAFTVPGGLLQDSGTPLLINKAAFQVFMMSDIIAMCLSTMVLCFLLWVVTIRKRQFSVVILDLSVSFLLASLLATLFTFMMGLYATTFAVKQWIAILAIVLCSLLVLLIGYKFVAIIFHWVRLFIKIFVKVHKNRRKSSPEKEMKKGE